jgi:hypothetical protein
MRIKIHFLESNSLQEVVVDSNRCTFGRSSKADVHIDLECFSRLHFEISYSGDEFYVTDLGSTNGVYLNSERIPTNQSVKFSNFFSIEVGGKVSFSFSLEEENDTLKRPIFIPKKKIPKSQNLSLAISKGLNRFKLQGPRTIVSMLALGVMILGFYMTTPADEAGTSLKKLSSTESKGLRPQLDISLSILKELNIPSLCDDALVDLCKKINLHPPQERVVISKKWLIVYVDYAIQMRDKGLDFFNKISENKRIEYILAGFAFNPLITKEALSKNIENIIVVGITPLNNFRMVKMAGVLDVVNLTPIDSDSYQSIFSGLYNGGIYRPFKKYLEGQIYFITN